MEHEGEHAVTGINRRTVLKRTAVGVGAFWAVPIVDSFLSPAAASSPGDTCIPLPAGLSFYAFNVTCGSLHYRVKISNTGSVTCGAGQGQQCEGTGGIPVLTFQTGCPPGGVGVSGSDPIVVTLGPGCTVDGNTFYVHDGSFQNRTGCFGDGCKCLTYQSNCND